MVCKFDIPYQEAVKSIKCGVWAIFIIFSTGHRGNMSGGGCWNEPVAV
ncbi:MAG: hypothetical protein LBJ67_19275 [Planctomycetaceae bacterium]|nr:hypothetical protein [Planctomycetaceae bacterium]